MKRNETKRNETIRYDTIRYDIYLHPISHSRVASLAALLVAMAHERLARADLHLLEVGQEPVEVLARQAGHDLGAAERPLDELAVLPRGRRPRGRHLLQVRLGAEDREDLWRLLKAVTIVIM